MSNAEISVIERTRVPFSAPGRSLFSRTAQWRRLQNPFKNQEQCQSNWCWAAVAASVANFYNKPAAAQKQCLIVTKFLNVDDEDCCNPECHTLEEDAPCNRPRKLFAVLYAQKCAEEATLFGPAELKRVRHEIDAGNPVCVRILWPDDDDEDDKEQGHFVTITGYLPESEMLLVADPLEPTEEIVISYQSLRENYGDLDGAWDQTYFTKDIRT